MKRETIVVRCTYSDTERTPEEFIEESFRSFLKRELLGLAICQSV